MTRLDTLIAELKSRRLLVVGLGKTGHSVCLFLSEHGVAFDAVDDRPEPPLAAEVAALPLTGTVLDSFSMEQFSTYDVLIVSPGVALTTPAIQAAIDAGVEVVGDVELFTRAAEAPIIAVTGSNGKSTVVAWLDAVLTKTKLNSVLCGNIGEPVLSALNSAADLYVLELSSFQLEATQSLHTLSATVLNISEDHMDRYTSLEEYASVKRKIYHGCETCVINLQDRRTWANSEDRAVADIIGFGEDAPATGEFGLQEHRGASWLANSKGPILPVAELPVPGLHNALNALAVLALLQPLALPSSDLIKGLKSFTGLPHRTELVSECNGVRWYNDSKGTNVDACAKAIAAMDGPVILIMGGLGKDADFAPLRALVAERVKALVLIGRDAGLIKQTLDGVVDAHDATDMHDAVSRCAALATTGDAVLLSPGCASFDMFDSFEQRGDVFTQAAQQVAA